MIRFLAILVPAVGNALAVLIWLPLLQLPDGAVIRPLRESFLGCLVALGTFALGLIVAGRAAAAGHRLQGRLCLGFSLTPLLVGVMAAQVFSLVKQLVWAD